MLDDNGARRQESLRVNPAMEQAQNFPYPLRGSVTAVYYQDDPKNKTAQTLVDIELLGGYSKLLGVPVLAPKVNRANGEEWTPDPGDIVVVQFVAGRWGDPIVTGYCHLPSNEIQARRANVPPGKRRYHRRCNQTDLVIDKDGNRTEYVEGDETVVIKGNESVTVQTGDITIDVVQGKCTVHIRGKTAWTSEGTIDLDGAGGGAVKGVVQGDCICALTGKPHIMVSASVKASE